MGKKLSEMSLEELWQVFPIYLTEHQRCWKKWYDEEEMFLHQLVGSSDGVSIYHIGSTAIEGIWAKPIVDILMELPVECDWEKLKCVLLDNGYQLMSESTERLSLNKGYTEQGFASQVYHLHIRRTGDRDEVYFRDYLNEHPLVAKEYERLKLVLWKQYEHNRDAYTEAKTRFVKKYTTLAKVRTIIEAYLKEQYYCSSADLQKKGTIYTINPKARDSYTKMIAYQDCTVVCTSANIQQQVRMATDQKSRDEIFEYPSVYGQTIHYVPDVKSTAPATLPHAYTYELLQKENISRLAGLEGFSNALGYDDMGNTPTVIAYIAREKDAIIGIAGASEVANGLWEVGVDVLPTYRHGGLGTNLVRALTESILEQGIVPVYSASVTNIGSQMVALRSGYQPCWVDSYGNK